MDKNEILPRTKIEAIRFNRYRGYKWDWIWIDYWPERLAEAVITGRLGDKTLLGLWAFLIGNGMHQMDIRKLIDKETNGDIHMMNKVKYYEKNLFEKKFDFGTYWDVHEQKKVRVEDAVVPPKIKEERKVYKYIEPKFVYEGANVKVNDRFKQSDLEDWRDLILKDSDFKDFYNQGLKFDLPDAENRYDSDEEYEAPDAENRYDSDEEYKVPDAAKGRNYYKIFDPKTGRQIGYKKKGWRWPVYFDSPIERLPLILDWQRDDEEIIPRRNNIVNKSMYNRKALAERREAQKNTKERMERQRTFVNKTMYNRKALAARREARKELDGNAFFEDW